MLTPLRQHPLIKSSISSIVQGLIELDPLGWNRGKDWQALCDRFRHPNLSYPAYYTEHNFHGIQGGYLSSHAAITYDPVSRLLLMPHEGMIRQHVIDAIQGQPRRILDIGCGTGSMTLMLKQAFPDAEVVGLDLSPYMLVMAHSKAQRSQLQVQFFQGNAEYTGFPDGSFDLVTASLLFHEVPSIAAQNILQEAHRLLAPGGEMIIFDGNQQHLQGAKWVNHIFEEPHLESYANSQMNDWLQAAGFEASHTEVVWWIHQVSRGAKPKRVLVDQQASVPRELRSAPCSAPVRLRNCQYSAGVRACSHKS